MADQQRRDDIQRYSRGNVSDVCLYSCAQSGWGPASCRLLEFFGDGHYEFRSPEPEHSPGRATITMQPVVQIDSPGGDVTFNAAASGSPAPTVQWQVSTNGTTFNDIPGATSTTYTFTSTATQSGDLFRAVFSNANGTATTDVAPLTILIVPTQWVVTTPPPDSVAARQGFTVIVQAEDASGNLATTFNGSVTVTPADGSSGLSGAATINTVGGIATFSNLSFDQAGAFELSITGSGLSAASTPTIAVSTAVSNLIPTFGHVSLPGSAIVGGIFKGVVPVVIRNDGADAINGETINLYADANPMLDGSRILLGRVKSNGNLKRGQSRSINFQLHSLPPALAAGEYHILAEVIDSTNAVNVAAATQNLNLQSATVILNLSGGNVVPVTVALNKFGSVSVTLANTGNSTAVGPLNLTCGLSTDGVTPVAGATLTQLTKQLKLAAGKSVRFKLRFKVSDAIAGGQYFSYISASLAGAQQTLVSSSPFTLG